jgi:hypothetical protein
VNSFRCLLGLHHWAPALAEASYAAVSPLGACLRQRCTHCPADEPLSLKVALRFKHARARNSRPVTR